MFLWVCVGVRQVSLRRGALSHAHETLPAGAGLDPLSASPSI